jgi:hypothetical protein
MTKGQRLGQHAVRVPTYTELERYVRAFAEGHLNLLMVFGNPGVGKSRSVRQALAGPVCWIGGQATAFGIFLEAYRHRHEPLVLDDVDALYARSQWCSPAEGLVPNGEDENLILAHEIFPDEIFGRGLRWCSPAVYDHESGGDDWQ